MFTPKLASTDVLTLHEDFHQKMDLAHSGISESNNGKQSSKRPADSNLKA